MHPAVSTRRLRGATIALVSVLIVAVMAFVARRLTVDASGQAAWIVQPPGSIDTAYARHPVLAYLHIAPGVVYLLGVPLQLWSRFRARYPRAHRRIGRVVLAAGATTGVFGVVFGTLFPFGGLLEATAAVLFGTYFLVALALALRAVRRGDIIRHRRWMIRAFAVALAVGTARFWLGLLTGFGVGAPLLPEALSLGVALWVAWVLHVLAAELYLVGRPGVGDR